MEIEHTSVNLAFENEFLPFIVRPDYCFVRQNRAVVVGDGEA